MSRDITNDFTIGSIGKHLLAFSVPYLLSNLLQACYGAVDTIVVGQTVGSAGTVAVGTGAQLMVILTAACSGLCIGGTVTLSQHKGLGDEEGQRTSIGTFFSISLIIAVTLSLLGILATSKIVYLMHTPSESVELACTYLRICCIGIPFIFGYNVVCAVLRGLGNSRNPLYFVAVASLSNIILDILFVIVMHLGSTGAALATVISQGVAFAVAAIFLIMQKNFVFTFHCANFMIVKNKLIMILKVGIPSMLQTMIVHISLLVVTSMINEYGLYASTANSIGIRLNNFFMLSRQAIAFAVSNIVGQNMGAGKSDRCVVAVKLGVLFSISSALILFSLINLFPIATTKIFDNSADVIAESSRYIHIVSFSYLLMAPMTVYNNLAIGVGNSTRSLINTITDSVFVRIPLCLIMRKYFYSELLGIYIGMALSPLPAVLMGWHYFHFGNWRTVSLIKRT